MHFSVSQRVDLDRNPDSGIARHWPYGRSDALVIVVVGRDGIVYFVTAASLKETSTRRASSAAWRSYSSLKMKKILNHWPEKTVSLVLALILWAVIKKNIETTTSRSRFQFELYGNPAKK